MLAQIHLVFTHKFWFNLGSRTLCNTSLTQEALLRRKLEEQQQAAELVKAIELQNRRFMGLQLLDLKNRSHFRPITNPSIAPIQSNGGSRIPQEESACQGSMIEECSQFTDSSEI